MSVMPIDTAMVLAAGLGTRMRPLTDFTPKPLIEVVGKALIDYTLDRFEAAGVKRTIVNVHYLADQIESHVADRVVPEIIVSDERAMLLETGGGLKKALPLLGTAPVFCSNTDAILVDGDGDEACARLSSTWDPERMDALLLLSPIKETSGYNGTGDADLDADGRVSFRKGERADYVFTGLQIIKAADMVLTEEDLRHGAPLTASDHLGERQRVMGDLNHLVIDASGVQDLPRSCAVRAIFFVVNNNLVHAYSPRVVAMEGNILSDALFDCVRNTCCYVRESKYLPG